MVDLRKKNKITQGFHKSRANTGVPTLGNQNPHLSLPAFFNGPFIFPQPQARTSGLHKVLELILNASEFKMRRENDGGGGVSYNS